MPARTADRMTAPTTARGRPRAPGSRSRRRSLGEDLLDVQKVEIDRLADADDVAERRRADVALEQAHEAAVLAARELLDGAHREARREQPSERSGRGGALHGAELRDAQVEPEASAVLLEVLREARGVVLRALGDDDERVRLAAAVRALEIVGDGLGIDLGLGHDDGVRAARDARHEREVPALATHDLEQERAPVRGGRDAQPVDGLERDVERRVDADRDLRSREIVVYRRRDAHDRQAHHRERERAGLAAVAADDQQAVDAVRREVREALLARRLLLERLEARAAEEGAAEGEGPEHVARTEGRDQLPVLDGPHGPLANRHGIP